VVVHECEPRPGRRGDPLIPGHADALRDLVAEETDPRIVDGPNKLGRAIARPAVDPRYVELAVSLAKHALQGDRQQVATIVRGDHHGDRLAGHSTVRCLAHEKSQVSERLREVLTLVPRRP